MNQQPRHLCKITHNNLSINCLICTQFNQALYATNNDSDCSGCTAIGYPALVCLACSGHQLIHYNQVRARRQLTLDSIGNERSRSRSPIVASANGCPDPASPLARRLSTNPFEILVHPSSLGQPPLSSVERISLKSFERRKSIYESEDIRQKKQESNLSGCENKPAGNNCDELSLDHLLPNVDENGSMATRDGANLCQNRNPDSPELHEFGKPGENTLLTYSTSESVSSDSDTSRKLRKDSADLRSNEIARGFEIAWLNFTYSVEPNVFEDPRWGRINSLFHKEKRMILKGLSGGLKSGQMVALMGPSGAGKTCLLECISGVRVTGIGGKICLRGRKSAQLVIVPQYDDFMPQFSVEEIITYGSRMKNPFRSNHKEITNTVIKQLGLQVCRSNNIQKCSGGQRKRVAIAQELVSKPNILILDEPTSGLDSSCCYQTMKVLRDVLDESVSTEQPMAIVTTIHQPSAKVFKMFDLVYLLGKTGFAAYSGPPDELLSTIRDVTGLECPQYSNPSDYMIELVSYDYGEEPVQKLIEFEKEKARLFVEQFERRVKGNEPNGIQMKFGVGDSKLEFANGARRSMSNENGTSLVNPTPEVRKPQLEHVRYEHNVSVPLRKATSGASHNHPFFWHSLLHLHRSYLQSIRDPILNNMRILIHLGFATLLVLLYGKKSGEARGCPPILGLPAEITDPNNESMIDLADNVGYLFMCIMMITYVSLMSTVLTFPIDIKTVGKEYKNGWYGTVTYFLGKSIADLPFIILYPVAYCLITWYMTNQAQDHPWRYFSFTGLIIMNAMNSQSFGLILGALFVNSVTAATFLGPVITIPWYLFTGFTKRVHRLAEPYKTTSRFLFTRYVFEGLLDTVYGHQRCNCSEFLQKYSELRYEEAARLGQLISAETLSSLDYYDGLDTVADLSNKTRFPDTGNKWFEKTVDAASTVFADGGDLNLASLMETNVKATSLFSFGLDFEPTCPANYKNYVVQDFRLEDSTTENAFVSTLCMLIVIRLLTFVVVTWKIRTRQL